MFQRHVVGPLSHHQQPCPAPPAVTSSGFKLFSRHGGILFRSSAGSAVVVSPSPFRQQLERHRLRSIRAGHPASVLRVRRFSVRRSSPTTHHAPTSSHNVDADPHSNERSRRSHKHGCKPSSTRRMRDPTADAVPQYTASLRQGSWFLATTMQFDHSNDVNGFDTDQRQFQQ